MESFSHLNTVAGIATSQLGFMAAFIGLVHSGGRKFDHFERHFIRTLAINAVAVIVACLAPGTLADAFPDSYIQISIVVFFVAGVFAASMAAIDLVKSLSSEEDDPFWWHAVGWAIGGAALFFIYFAYTGQAAGAWYKLAATTLLGVPIWCFIAIVFRRFFK